MEEKKWCIDGENFHLSHVIRSNSGSTVEGYPCPLIVRARDRRKLS
jgi:hypothetical protein